MAYASGRGNVETNPESPRAYAVCDRCGRWWNHYKLRFQWQYAGAGLVNLFLLVCPYCYDVPSQFLRSILIPPDPLPIQYPRPEFFAADEGPIPAETGSVTQLVPD